AMNRTRATTTNATTEDAENEWRTRASRDHRGGAFLRACFRGCVYWGRLKMFAPGWVPEMKPSVMPPGVSSVGSTLPVDLSTDRKMMLPGAANPGGSYLSGRPST